MKRTLALMLLSLAMLMTLAACGEKKDPTPTPDPNPPANTQTTDKDNKANKDNTVSDATFTELQDNFAAMTEAYNAVKAAYESDAIAVNPEVEQTLNDAADLINEMGEISQDTLVEADAETLNEAMLLILSALSDTLSAMTPAQ